MILRNMLNLCALYYSYVGLQMLCKKLTEMSELCILRYCLFITIIPMKNLITKILQADDWAHHHTALVLAGVFLSGFMAFWQLLMPQMETHAAWSASYCQDNIATLAIPVEECETLSIIYQQFDGFPGIYYSSPDTAWFDDADGSNVANWHGIDLSGGNVVKISIFGNGLATGQVLSFSGLDYLTDLFVRSAEIAAVDISQNLLLDSVDIRYTPITSIDLSANTLLERVDLEANDLTTVDVSMLPNLRSLALSYNPIVNGINVTNNSMLEYLSYF